MMKRRSGLLIIIVISVIGIHPALGQEAIWVVVEGTAPVTANDQDKARNQALESAEHNAVAEALAPNITVETLLVNFRLSGRRKGAIPYGKVATKRILEEGLIESPVSGSSAHGLLYRVRMKAGVMQETGGEDPSFYLDAATNQSVFKQGEEMEINVRSTRNCNLAIFNILADNKIVRLLPNYLSGNTFLSSNQEYTFPSKEDRRKGIKLRLHLPKNKVSVKEYIYILALPHAFAIDAIDVQEGIWGSSIGQTASVRDLIGVVVNIPLKDRAEALMAYEIRKAKKGE